MSLKADGWYRLVAEALDGAVYEWDLGTGRIEHSGGLERVIGVGPGEADDPGEWWRARVHPDDLETIAETLRASAESGASSMETEYRVEHADGHWIWFHDTGRLVRADDGRVVRVVGVRVDVTGIREAAEALRESEQRFRTLADSMPQLVWAASGDGVRVDYHNASHAEYEGGEAGRAGEWTWFSALHPSDLAPTLAAWEAAVGTGTPYVMEHRLRVRDGSYRWHISRAQPAYGADGRIAGWYGTATDIHHLKTTESALEESQGRLQHALDAGRMGTWAIDLASGAFDASPQCRTIFGGRPGSPFRYEDFMAALHPDGATRLRAEIDRAVALAADFEVECRVRGADGPARWVLVRGGSSPGPEARAMRMAGVAVDITVRKHAEEVLARDREALERLVAERTAELAAASERLRSTERMATIGTLAAGLGHDIGNLLLPVRMRLDAIEACVEGPRLREDIGAVRKAADYLQQLSGSLRLLAADPFEQREEIEPTDLGAWWEEAAGMMRNGLPRLVRLEADIAPGLPPIALNRAGLTQAVFNLVQNAGDALAEAPDPCVRIAARADEQGGVVLTVQDNGMGMTEEVRRRCLEPFFTTKARGLGTGLGLALVGAILQRSGSDVRIESEPGRGSVFTLRLARAMVAEGSPRPVAIVTLANGRPRAHVELVLGSLGYEVRHGEEAIAEAEVWVREGAAPGHVEKTRRFVAGGARRRVIVLRDVGGADMGGADVPGVISVESGLKPSLLRERLREALAAPGVDAAGL